MKLENFSLKRPIFLFGIGAFDWCHFRNFVKQMVSIVFQRGFLGGCKKLGVRAMQNVVGFSASAQSMWRLSFLSDGEFQNNKRKLKIHNS